MTGPEPPAARERLQGSVGGRANGDKSGRRIVSKPRPSCEWPREENPAVVGLILGEACGKAAPEQPPRGRSSSVTSQVSSPAEQADETVVGEQRKEPGAKDVRRLDRVI